MTFQQKLQDMVAKNNSLLCIGLDPDLEKLPDIIRSKPNPLFEFNKAIIDVTADLACTFKPNPAFYEAYGSDGVVQLKMTADYLRQNYPDIPILLDTKRADIGNSNLGYAKYAFDYIQADAITLPPYMGGESLRPFFEWKDKGFFILVRTSNPGSGEFQDLMIDGKPLYEHVAQSVTSKWNQNGNCMLMVGATYPKELADLRRIAGGDMPILIAGLGAQGGDVKAAIEAGIGDNGQGLVANASRSIIYASNGEDFAEAARVAAQKMRDEINEYRKGKNNE
ncbi:MAG: orotidine-5'-phosphate decarboxylase [Patescibacteria group bacterium]